MQKAFPNRKDSIIISAIDILNELGIQGLSTKELATREGIAESALYRHYKNKDDILAAILEHFSSFDEAIYRTVMSRNINAKDAIIAFMTAYLEYYENYPAITSILDLSESMMNEESVKEKLKEILSKRTQFLIMIIEQGQEKGEISRLFTADELVAVVFGFNRSIITSWRFASSSFNLKEKVLDILTKLLELI